MYPPEIAGLPGGYAYLHQELRKMGPWSPAEVRAAVLMAVAIGLWVTDFLHHIPAPMIGLGIGLVAILPWIGVLNPTDVRTINYLPIFFVAAAVSLSNVLAQTKALDVVTTILFNWIQPFISTGWLSTTVLYWSAFLYHIAIGNEIAMLSTSIPPLMQYARQHDLNPLALGMIWTFSAGPKLFHVRNGRVRRRPLVRVLRQPGPAEGRRRVVGGDLYHPHAARAAVLAAHWDRSVKS